MAPEVLDAIMPYLTDEYGNPGSLHTLGRRAASAVQLAREQAARLFGGKPENVIFTSGGSESNNLVFKGVGRLLASSGNTGVIVSATEHESVLKAAESLTKDGFYIRKLYPDKDLMIRPGMAHFHVGPDVGLISVMQMNNELGTINDTGGIAALCKQQGILFHTDCVQSAGHVEIDAEINGYDFVSVSSHKIHGPKGVGALYVRDKSMLDPLICGGSEQEFGLRGGTENVAGIVGFGRACEMAVENIKENREHIWRLRHLFCETLKRQRLGGIHINGSDSGSKVLSLTVDGVDNESLLLMLDANGVCISAGSACQSREVSPSHVLKAIGLTDEQARSTVRVSFSRYNTMNEVEQAANTFVRCVEDLRRVS